LARVTYIIGNPHKEDKPSEPKKLHTVNDWRFRFRIV